MSLKYLEEFESVSTVKVYKAVLKKYFQTIYGEQEHDIEQCAKRYFEDSSRDFEEDIKRFFISLKGVPPKTRNTYLGAVRTFLIENGVELPQAFWRRLRKRIKGRGPVSEEQVPTVEELRSIMMHLPVQGKALYLMLLSSGMRIGEALQLTMDDIDLDHDPPIVRIRPEYTKTGDKRITFISSEAKEALLEWLKVRNQYLESVAAKTPKKIKPRGDKNKEVAVAKSRDDPRIFPFTQENARAMWHNALEKTGNGKVDPRTRRLLMRPHVLRKFFRSALGRQSIDLTEGLMGHRGYLTEVYRRYDLAELGKFYKENEHLLMLSPPPTLQREVVQQRERLSQLQNLVNGLTAENLALRQRLQNLEESLNLYQRNFGELVEKHLPKLVGEQMLGLLADLNLITREEA